MHRFFLLLSFLLHLYFSISLFLMFDLIRTKLIDYFGSETSSDIFCDFGLANDRPIWSFFVKIDMLIDYNQMIGLPRLSILSIQLVH